MLFDEKLPLKINSLKGEMNNKNEKNWNSLIIVCLCVNLNYPRVFWVFLENICTDRVRYDILFFFFQTISEAQMKYTDLNSFCQCCRFILTTHFIHCHFFYVCALFFFSSLIEILGLYLLCCGHAAFTDWTVSRDCWTQRRHLFSHHLLR